MAISVISLIGLFSGIASYLITLSLSFIGLSYVIIYVGAVSILFLFILMLIDIKISELLNYSNNSISFSLGKGIILSSLRSFSCKAGKSKQTDLGIRFYSSKVKLPGASSVARPITLYLLQYQQGRGIVPGAARRLNLRAQYTGDSPPEKHNLSFSYESTTTTMNP